MRRFAEILQNSESRLAAARAWLAEAWARISSPHAFRRLLDSKPMQTELRWKLRLTEALLRLAITQRANAIIPPPMTPARRRGHTSGILLPADPFGPAYVARFRLSPQLSRWAIQPPASAPQTRKPQHAAALLHRLLACQDGLERFEKLAWLEAKRKRRNGMAHSFSMALSPAPSLVGPQGRAKDPDLLQAHHPTPLAHFGEKCNRGFVPENAQIQTIRASNPAKSGSDFADDALDPRLRLRRTGEDGGKLHAKASPRRGKRTPQSPA